MKITFLGHATLLIQLEKHLLLVDPFISGNEKAKGLVDSDSLNPDYILIMHAHEDHILDVEQIAGKSGAMIISNYEIASHYKRRAFRHIR